MNLSKLELLWNGLGVLFGEGKTTQKPFAKMGLDKPKKSKPKINGSGLVCVCFSSS